METTLLILRWVLIFIVVVRVYMDTTLFMGVVVGLLFVYCELLGWRFRCVRELFLELVKTVKTFNNRR